MIFTNVTEQAIAEQRTEMLAIVVKIVGQYEKNLLKRNNMTREIVEALLDAQRAKAGKP